MEMGGSPQRQIGPYRGDAHLRQSPGPSASKFPEKQDSPTPIFNDYLFYQYRDAAVMFSYRHRFYDF